MTEETSLNVSFYNFMTLFDKIHMTLTSKWLVDLCYVPHACTRPSNKVVFFGGPMMHCDMPLLLKLILPDS